MSVSNTAPETRRGVEEVGNEDKDKFTAQDKDKDNVEPVKVKKKGGRPRKIKT
jgi:hypothetical protein